MNIVRKVKEFFRKRKQEREFKKKLEELRKRDPFVYKNM
jgi:hypothetical protein